MSRFFFKNIKLVGICRIMFPPIFHSLKFNYKRLFELLHLSGPKAPCHALWIESLCCHPSKKKDLFVCSLICTNCILKILLFIYMYMYKKNSINRLIICIYILIFFTFETNMYTPLNNYTYILPSISVF